MNRRSMGRISARRVLGAGALAAFLATAAVSTAERAPAPAECRAASAGSLLERAKGAVAAVLAHAAGHASAIGHSVGVAGSPPPDGDFSMPLAGTGAAGGEAPAGVSEHMVYVSGENGRTVRVEVRDGKVSAEIDGEPCPPENVRVEAEQIIVMGRDGREVARLDRHPARMPRAFVGGAPPGGRGEEFFPRMAPRWFAQPPAGGGGQPEVKIEGKVVIIGPDGTRREFDLGKSRGEGGHWRFGDEGHQFELNWTPGKGWQQGLGGFTLAPQQPRVMIGITMSDGDAGIEIDRVMDALPASRAGLKSGDVIVGIDGRRDGITSQGLREILAGRKPGETITLHVRRGGEEKKFGVTLDAYDADRLGIDPAPQWLEIPGVQPAPWGQFEGWMQHLDRQRLNEAQAEARKAIENALRSLRQTTPEASRAAREALEKALESLKGIDENIQQRLELLERQGSRLVAPRGNRGGTLELVPRVRGGTLELVPRVEERAPGGAGMDQRRIETLERRLDRLDDKLDRLTRLLEEREGR